MGLLQTTKLNSNLTTVPEAVRNYLELDSDGRVEWHVEEGLVVVRKASGADTDGGAVRGVLE